MARTKTGVVVSTGMLQTIVVEVTRRTPHPKYKKLIKRSKNFKADSAGKSVKVGDTVVIAEIKPMSKDKHFVLQSITTQKGGTV